MKYWLPAALAVALLAPAGAAAQAPPADAWIVVYDRDDVTSVDRETDVRERRRGFRSRLRFRRGLEGFSARLTAEQVRALRADPDVEAVVRDTPVRASAAQPLAPGEPVAPTGVRRIGLAAPESPSAPAWVREASDVGVAVVDTGIDLDHPELNAADGTDCIDPNTPAEDGDGHGTHVAGTIGAENDGQGVPGVTGVAPGTKVHAVRVLNDEGAGSTSTVLCGIDWVIANASARNIRVINMSLGGPANTDDDCDPANGDVLHAAICRARDAGILSVVAAGNETADIQDVPVDPLDPTKGSAPGAPASYPEVLTVTAMNDLDGAGGTPDDEIVECTATGDPFRDDRRAPYSNYATTTADAAHVIAAPGSCILSTAPGGGYDTLHGTSMATPHVAGAVALCIGERGAPGPCPGLSPAQIIQKLRADAEAYRLANPSYGFRGDPQLPFPSDGSRYFGYLIRPAVPGPQTSITSAPPDTTQDHTPTFEFSSPSFGMRFECSIDGSAFSPCSSPLTTGELGDGQHQIAVRAVDVAGTADPTAAGDSFTVETPPPAPPTTSNAPVPTEEPEDVLAPTASLSAATRQRLSTVLRKGIRVGVLCSEACRADERVMLRSTVAGRKRLVLGSGRRYVTIKLTSSARRRLARVRSVLAQIRVTVTDAAGNARTVKKNIRLTR